MDLQKLKYPVGEYVPNTNPNVNTLESWIQTIELFPQKIRTITSDLPIEKLQWKYRPGGWMIKQVVHHCAESHMNAVIRFKLALTEDKPTIRPYFEDRWTELPDDLGDDLDNSIQLLEALHRKWILIIKNMTDEQLQREFIHPEHGRTFILTETIGNYAWHCNHHYAHIVNALNSNGEYNESLLI